MCINYVMESYINWLYLLVIWINFISVSIKGQPQYKRQKALSQCVRYSEVLLQQKQSKKESKHGRICDSYESFFTRHHKLT